MSADPPDPSLPAQLRAFPATLPLVGDPPNALLSLPDDRILHLATVLRDTPQAAPALAPEEWREFLAYRLGTRPEGCRPPAVVMDFLRRQHLPAVARSSYAGRANSIILPRVVHS
ncbi:MAG: hypothetical protein ABFC89_06250 [Methanospirillum sp.]